MKVNVFMPTCLTGLNGAGLWLSQPPDQARRLRIVRQKCPIRRLKIVPYRIDL